MKLSNLQRSAIAGLFFFLSAGALAGPIVTGTWYEFGWSGSTVSGCTSCTPSVGGNTIFADDPPWTITLLTNSFLTVQDAFLTDDQFEVFNFGGSLGTTSAYTAGGECGSNPDICALDPNSSRGVFALSPGSYSFTFGVNPPESLDSGASYFRVDAAVPEPSVLALLALSLFGAGIARRRLSKA